MGASWEISVLTQVNDADAPSRAGAVEGRRPVRSCVYTEGGPAPFFGGLNGVGVGVRGREGG